MKATLRFVVALAWIVTSGCGYALVGKGNFLPDTIKTIHLPSFVNRTTRVELEQRVTQAVADELVSRGRLKLVSRPEEADVILKGSINTFNINPVSVNQLGRAERYQVVITSKIELVDHRAEDKVIWKNDHYVFTESYEVKVEAETFDQETRAIREIADRFAKSVVSNLLEGF